MISHCITIQSRLEVLKQGKMSQIKQEEIEEKPQEVVDNTMKRQQWNAGPWSEEENIKCIAFLDYNRHQLNSKLKIKENKFFKQLSIFVVSRSPIQCRSQCYKLLRKHKTYYNIISNFRNAEANPDFNLIYENLRQDPSIKFRGPQEITPRQLKDRSIMSDMQTQTEKSYLLRSYLKSHPAPKNDIPQAADINNYPFIRAGWFF